MRSFTLGLCSLLLLVVGLELVGQERMRGGAGSNAPPSKKKIGADAPEKAMNHISLPRLDEVDEDLLKVRVYNADPEHLWNRLHSALFVRVGPDRRPYGLDRLEPLLWVGSKYLLEKKSHQRAVAILDEFLKNNGLLVQIQSPRLRFTNGLSHRLRRAVSLWIPGLCDAVAGRAARF